MLFLTYCLNLSSPQIFMAAILLGPKLFYIYGFLITAAFTVTSCSLVLSFDTPKGTTMRSSFVSHFMCSLPAQEWRGIGPTNTVAFKICGSIQSVIFVFVFFFDKWFRSARFWRDNIDDRWKLPVYSFEAWLLFSDHLNQRPFARLLVAVTKVDDVVFL